MVADCASQRVTVVTVTYNSLNVLPEMLASIPDGATMVIVDNASDDPDAVSDVGGRSGARVICNSQNLGFGAACNIGAAQAQTEFLLFLNPDAQLFDGALDALVTAADNFTAASAFNPAITDRRGRSYLKRGSVLLPASDRLPPGWPTCSRTVPVLSGAALFVRRAAFEAVNGFDPDLFMYHEDDDLSLRLKAACGPLYFVRDARVRHHGGSASPRTPETAAFKAFHMGRSRIHAARKHNVQGAQRKALFSALIQLATPFTLFSARKRAKQMAFLRGVRWAIKNEAIR